MLGRARKYENAQCDGATHHQAKTRVPCASQIEETFDLERVGHACQDQTQAEDQAAYEAEQVAHDRAQIPCRSTNTVMKPALMNASTFTRDRIEKRLKPHTP